MSQLGQVSIGHKAPDFHCEAVVGGAIKGTYSSWLSKSTQSIAYTCSEVSLSTFIRPSASPDSPDPDRPWLLLLFIPAAFSFVCPTEVIAFQNCYDEFKDRNCNIAFVSVNTKHSLWHWQNIPHQYGGLGNIDIPLLSDATHKIGQDYGVLIEEEGISLRGMFIIDNDGLVQQVSMHMDTCYSLRTRYIQWLIICSDYAQQPHCRTKCSGSPSPPQGVPGCCKA